MSSGAIPYGGTKKHPYNVVVRIFFIGKGKRTRGKTNSLADCEFYGIFEGEKFVANLSEMGEYEIQVPQQRILV